MQVTNEELVLSVFLFCKIPSICFCLTFNFLDQNICMKKIWLWAFLAITVASVILFIVFNFIVFKNPQSKIINKYADNYGLETALVYSIIKNESGFNSKAVSRSGAIGLMQLMPSTAKWIAGELGVFYSDDILFDEDTNVCFGCFYLNYLFKKFKSEDIVICAYNAGESKVLSWLDENGNLDKSKIDYDETKTYLDRVLKTKEIYK